uniref:BTAD domain-containing putative transcriptional regulator n=1 Tax=Nonomuraea gerenzanensis TaxID=93944 RepID=UPI00287FEB63|nr:BTAD domain-containing putative transcriptional regulator [Nonomuraea gerenzanensis]
MEFRILGTVGAVHEGAAIVVGGPRHRRLLAVLLLRAGQVVPVPALTDALWGERPPRSAGAMIHVRVSELRTALRVTGSRVLTRDGGYLLKVGPDELDAVRFERLAAAGAAALAAGDPVRARADLVAGLALWRGPALGEFADEAFARADAIRLGELRLQAVEQRIAADLELGRHDSVVAELRKLVHDQPLRERFWGQLMLALYRGGRQGEALEAYRSARDHLTDQLGLEPGDALRSLHHAILTADPSLRAPGRAVVVPSPDPADARVGTGKLGTRPDAGPALRTAETGTQPGAGPGLQPGTAGAERLGYGRPRCGAGAGPSRTARRTTSRGACVRRWRGRGPALERGSVPECGPAVACGRGPPSRRSCPPTCPPSPAAPTSCASWTSCSATTPPPGRRTSPSPCCPAPRGSARRRSPCTGRTAPATGSPTGTCTWTCAATTPAGPCRPPTPWPAS